MTMVVTTYLFAEPQLALGRYVPYNIAIIVGAIITLLISGFYIYKLATKKKEK